MTDRAGHKLHKFSILSPEVYLQAVKAAIPVKEDDVAYRFGRFLKKWAEDVFDMSCYLPSKSGVAFIEDFNRFEGDFLVKSEYCVIIISDVATKPLNRFLARLLVFVTMRSIWRNRFIFIALGQIEGLSDLYLDVSMHGLITFNSTIEEEWVVESECWKALYMILNISWAEDSGEDNGNKAVTGVDSTEMEISEVGNDDTDGAEFKDISQTHKLFLLTSKSYSMQASDEKSKDSRGEEFAEFLCERAMSDFKMSCSIPSASGGAFITDFNRFEDQFLRTTEYCTFIVSEESVRRFRIFLPRLLVFLTRRSGWCNRFLIICVGRVDLREAEVDFLIHPPIYFLSATAESWSTETQSWELLYRILRITWSPVDSHGFVTKVLFDSQMDYSMLVFTSVFYSASAHKQPDDNVGWQFGLFLADKAHADEYKVYTLTARDAVLSHSLEELEERYLVKCRQLVFVVTEESVEQFLFFLVRLRAFLETRTSWQNRVALVCVGNVHFDEGQLAIFGSSVFSISSTVRSSWISVEIGFWKSFYTILSETEETVEETKGGNNVLAIVEQVVEHEEIDHIPSVDHVDQKQLVEDSDDQVVEVEEAAAQDHVNHGQIVDDNQQVVEDEDATAQEQVVNYQEEEEVSQKQVVDHQEEEEVSQKQVVDHHEHVVEEDEVSEEQVVDHQEEEVSQEPAVDHQEEDHQEEDEVSEEQVVDHQEEEVSQEQVVDHQEEEEVSQEQEVDHQEEEEVSQEQVMDHQEEEEVSQEQVMDHQEEEEVSQEQVVDHQEEEEVSQEQVVDHQEEEEVSQEQVVDHQEEQVVEEGGKVKHEYLGENVLQDEEMIQPISFPPANTAATNGNEATNGNQAMSTSSQSRETNHETSTSTVTITTTRVTTTTVVNKSIIGDGTISVDRCDQSQTATSTSTMPGTLWPQNVIVAVDDARGDHKGSWSGHTTTQATSPQILRSVHNGLVRLLVVLRSTTATTVTCTMRLAAAPFRAIQYRRTTHCGQQWGWLRRLLSLLRRICCASCEVMRCVSGSRFAFVDADGGDIGAEFMPGRTGSTISMPAWLARFLFYASGRFIQHRQAVLADGGGVKTCTREPVGETKAATATMTVSDWRDANCAVCHQLVVKGLARVRRVGDGCPYTARSFWGSVTHTVYFWSDIFCDRVHVYSRRPAVAHGVLCLPFLAAGPGLLTGAWSACLGAARSAVYVGQAEPTAGAAAAAVALGGAHPADERAVAGACRVWISPLLYRHAETDAERALFAVRYNRRFFNL